MRLKSRVRRWISRGAVWWPGPLAGGGQVDALHRLHQAFQRRHPALEQERVDEHGADDREADQQNPLQRDDRAGVGGGEQGGDDGGGGDQDGVDRQDLRKKGSGTHRARISIGTNASGQYPIHRYTS